jgi:hypothetical protein
MATTRQALHQNGSDRVADSNPHNGRACTVQRLQQDEVLILRNNARVEVPCTRPDFAIGLLLQTEITNVCAS